MRRRTFPLAAIAWLLLTGGTDDARGRNAASRPSTASVIAAARRQLAVCDSLWTDMTYVTTTHQRELNSDGTTKNETVYRSRVFARRTGEREVLEAMWENGQPVSEKTLRREIRKREKERRRRAAGESGGDGSLAAAVLEPLSAENAENYDFPEIVLDTLDGIETWRITVQPREDSEERMRGTAWIAADTYRAVAEEYEPAKLPGKLKALRWRLDYDDVGSGCAVPRRFHIAGHGRALIFIKFRFETEVLFDSVRINPGLPDSLFETAHK